MELVLAVLVTFIFCYWITAAYWVEIVIENKSVSTRENMRFSNDIIKME